MKPSSKLSAATACLLLSLLAGWPAPTGAACPTGTFLQSSEPGDGSLVVAVATLPVGTQREVLAVTHGTASLGAQLLTWAPKTSFWSVGTSTVTLRYWTASSSWIQTYLILAGGKQQEPTGLSFDGDRDSLEWLVNANVVEGLASNAAAFQGTGGFRFLRTDEGDPYLEGRTRTPFDNRGDTRGGRTGRTAFQGPPPTNLPNGVPSSTLEQGVVLLSTGPVATPHFEVRVRSLAGLELQLLDRRVAGSAGQTPWKALSSAAHQLELHSWLDSDNLPGGAQLRVDGAHFLALDTPAPTALGETWPWLRVGMVGAGGVIGAYDVDETSIAFGRGERYGCQAANDFENSALDAPFQTFQGQNLTIGSTGALLGNKGLTVAINGSGSGGSAHFTVPATTTVERQGVRFRFDPNGVGLVVGGSPVNLAEGMTSLGGAKAFRVQLVQLTETGYGLRVLGRSGDLMVTSAPVALTDEPHLVELDWQRSTTDQRPTGYLRVWLDGDDAGRFELMNLDNDHVPLTGVRVGAVLGTSTGGTGTVLVDEIQLWREN